jgi:hypothetical protein
MDTSPGESSNTSNNSHGGVDEVTYVTASAGSQGIHTNDRIKIRIPPNPGPAQVYREIPEGQDFVCMFTTNCSSGQVNHQKMRKTISNFFGRNRIETSLIDTLTICRVHYQRPSYNHYASQLAKLELWIPEQVSMILEQFGNGMKFRIGFKRSEQERLNNYHQAKSQGGTPPEDPFTEYVPPKKKAKAANGGRRRRQSESQPQSTTIQTTGLAESDEHPPVEPVDSDSGQSSSGSSGYASSPPPDICVQSNAGGITSVSTRQIKTYMAPLVVLNCIQAKWGGEHRSVQDIVDLLQYVWNNIRRGRLTSIPLFEMIPEIDRKIINAMRESKKRKRAEESDNIPENSSTKPTKSNGSKKSKKSGKPKKSKQNGEDV